MDEGMNPLKAIQRIRETLSEKDHTSGQKPESKTGRNPRNTGAGRQVQQQNRQGQKTGKERNRNDNKPQDGNNNKEQGKNKIKTGNTNNRKNEHTGNIKTGQTQTVRGTDKQSRHTQTESGQPQKHRKSGSTQEQVLPSKTANNRGSVKNTQKSAEAEKPGRNRTKETMQKKSSGRGNSQSRQTGSPKKTSQPASEQLNRIINQKPSHNIENKSETVRVLPDAKIKIIPLGGLEQIGMNITAFEYNDSIMIVDCGLAFPSDDMLGIDLVIPDITYLKDNFSKVRGFVITHGHEDHIGAIPYVLKQLNVPVYATKLTIALIEHKLEEHGIEKSAKLNIVKHGQTVRLGDFKVEFVKTNHSISDSSALAIFTPAGTVFHTGDFKIDYTPVFGEAADLQRMAQLGREGVLALMCDSTNAIRPGFTMSEKTVGRTFDIIFSEHKQNRIIVATFASNVDRVQQIINTAYRYGRKVVVEGRSMVNVIGIANELGYIQIPEGTLIDIENLKNYPPENTVIITTGSQGESMAALSRMASSTHRKVSIDPSDVIIMSSHPIPGNEKAVDKVINELSMKGAEVIFQDTHVSGHACAEEIKLMYALLRPKFALPVHGEYRHLKAQMEIAEAVGIPKENILIMSSGDVVELSQDSCKVVGQVQAGAILVDGLGVGDVGNVVLRDRQNLSQNGIIIVTLTVEKGSKSLLAGPDIISRGFVYIKESEDLMDQAQAVVKKAVNDCIESQINDWSKFKNAIRDSLSDFLWKRMKRNPMILPIIMQVD